MATNAYASLSELKTWLRIADTNDDTLLDALLDSTSRWIDYHTRRHFFLDTAATRYFSAHCDDVLLIDDLDTLTTLKTDEDADGTYETTWASTDYHLEPFSKKVGGLYQPHSAIHVAVNGDNLFPPYRKAVQVVGNFGWATVPNPVRECCLMLASRWYKRGESPLDSLSSPEFGSQAVMNDPDVKLILAPFVAPPVIG